MPNFRDIGPVQTGFLDIGPMQASAAGPATAPPKPPPVMAAILAQ